MTSPFIAPALADRRAGVLLHPSSLPGRHGLGDLGPEARRFADWLVAAGAAFWQVLPLCPTGGPRLDVPYASWAALAGNPDFLSLDDLHAEGLVRRDELDAPAFPAGWAELEEVLAWKRPLLERAAARLLEDPRHPLREPLAAFGAGADWAEDAALFAAVKARHSGSPWWTWPAPLRSRAPAALDEARRALAAEVDRAVALQFLFERQWAALRAHLAARGVRVLGDVPIYVLHDSADVWAHPEAPTGRGRSPSNRRHRLGPHPCGAVVSGADGGGAGAGPARARDRCADERSGLLRAPLLHLAQLALATPRGGADALPRRAVQGAGGAVREEGTGEVARQVRAPRRSRTGGPPHRPDPPRPVRLRDRQRGVTT